MNIFSLIFLGDDVNMNGNSKVPYTMGNIKKCMCPKCPVQASSKCAMDKLDSLVKGLESAGGNVPDPQNVPGVYCSTGKATCQDLDLDQQCICYTCAVWKEYNLGNSTPSMYFCKNGKAT